MQGKTYCFLVVAMAVLLLSAVVAHGRLPMATDGLTRNCLNDGQPCEYDRDCCWNLCASVGGRYVCA
ncbi:hypothetical protein V6N13_038212 [Hibiscus sabdariffa]|uniref:Uncharacterized protein n=1 Tax=Hibiscus sabdariffa TaxID=183260 RepID=A0ABR2S2M0_9ROSI